MPAAVRAQAGAGIAPTPPMGWANWNSLGCNYNEDTIRAIAGHMLAQAVCVGTYSMRAAD